VEAGNDQFLTARRAGDAVVTAKLYAGGGGGGKTSEFHVSPINTVLGFEHVTQPLRIEDRLNNSLNSNLS
jgi:hypothetical protein